MDKHIFHVRFHTNMPRQLNSGIQNYTLTREEFGIQLQKQKSLREGSFKEEMHFLILCTFVFNYYLGP